ncbi:MAG: lysozyme family protein [Eubacteriales bacterium]|nr:lysozyme family protein [Eubacteriales bacterium]
MQRRRRRRRRVRRQRLLLILIVLLALAGLTAQIFRFIGNKEESSEPSYRLSNEVEEYRYQVQSIASEYGIEEYTELLLALMMQESSGLGTDVFQSSECGFNTEYPRVPGGITDTEYSIRCGVQEMKYALEQAGVRSPQDLKNIKVALQAYNFGTNGYLQYMEKNGLKEWSRESAEAFAQMASQNTPRTEGDPYLNTAGPWNYGDQRYPEHVLRYYVGLSK